MKLWECRKSPRVRVFNEKRSQNQALENPDIYKSEQENLKKELVKNGLSNRKKYQERVVFPENKESNHFRKEGMVN